MADTSNSVLFDAPGPKGRRTIRIVNWIAGILFAVVLVLILMRLHNPRTARISSAGSCGSPPSNVKRGPTSTCPDCG